MPSRLIYIVARYKCAARQFNGNRHAATKSFADILRDFTATPRMLQLAAMAAVAGTMGAGAAWCLLRLIALFTNLAYCGRSPARSRHSIPAHLPLWSIAIPVIGSLVIGLMARFGSEKIRGHGIPEAIEAILIGRSRIEPKVALLKPLSSAISIGTGGPFGAEGPIIMTGGALGSLFAQLFPSQLRRTQNPAGGGRRRRHDRRVRHADRRRAAGGGTAAVRMEAAQLHSRDRRGHGRLCLAAAPDRQRAAVSLSPRDPAMPWWGLGLCAVAGLVAGAQSALLTLLLYGVEDLFRRLPIHWMWWPALGGVVVGIGGVIDPAVLGVGYDNIRALLAGTLEPAGGVDCCCGTRRWSGSWRCRRAPPAACWRRC